ncbi:hypothetical protein [Pseudomonas allokribbensis]|uniref:hypothetical protein n=1 Tax=Pseudomonas allokribbensis TaxID=2774460 RepID=UPI0017888AAB|nr:hypothetical protein [Pseudomonas allokribbensis]
MSAAQPMSEGTLTADVDGLEPPVKDSYAAETVHLTAQYDVLFKQQAWTARGEWWIDGPSRPRRSLSIVLNVAQTASLNTTYDLNTDVSLVRAVFVERLAVGIDPFYPAIKGTVTFLSFPAAGSEKGQIEAEFEFCGRNGDDLPKNVTISKGKARIHN